MSKLTRATSIALLAVLYGWYETSSGVVSFCTGYPLLHALYLTYPALR
jgi:hypothetical protein